MNGADCLADKLRALGRVCRAGRLPADLRRLCAERMIAGHDRHGGRAFAGDWRMELAEEVADGVGYCALGGDRGLRVRIVAALLGLVWRALGAGDGRLTQRARQCR